jgi:hypothetical protein
MLSKNINQSLIPGSPGVEARAYVPAQSGRYEIDIYYQATEYYGALGPTTSPQIPYKYSLAPIRVGRAIIYSTSPVAVGSAYNPDYWDGSASLALSLSSPPTTITSILPSQFGVRSTSYASMQYLATYYPAAPAQPAVGAVPATPTQVAYTYNIGWNSVTTSVGSLLADGTASFGASAGALGVYVGITATRYSPQFGQFSHAMLCSKNMLEVYEGGTVVTTAIPYLPTDRLAIRRMGGIVEYSINSIPFYTSLAPSVGEVWMATMLYSGGDTVI